MSEKEQERRSLMSEMQRRHVFRTLIGYAVFGWVIVQVADVLIPAFHGPDWGVRAITTALVVGFPLVMVLSWLFDVGGDGIVRTEDGKGASALRATRWFRIAVVVPTLLATGGVTWYLWSGDFIVDGGQSWESAQRENPVIAVLPVRNLTGDESLDWLEDGFSILLRNQLASSKHTIVVSDSGIEPLLRDDKTKAEIIRAAADANIDFLITGEIIRSPGGLILTERVTDVEANIDVVAQSFPDLTPETLIGSVDQLTRIVMQGLKLPYVQQQQSLAADFAVDNIAAYEAFNAGLVFFNEFEYDEGVRSLETALELAPDFHIARYRLAHVLLSMGREAEAQEMIASIPEDAVLSRREELYIDAARALIPRELDTAIERYQVLLEEFPYEVDARVFLSEAYYHDYQDYKAIEQLELIAAQEPENEHAWSTIGFYNLQLGELEAARIAIDRYTEISPEKAHAWTLSGDLAAQTQDFEEAIQHYDRALEMDDRASLAALGAARARLAIGDRTGAKSLLEQLVGDAEAIPADRTEAALDLAYVLRAELDHEQSILPLTELQEEFEAEQILYAEALAVEALSLLEIGEDELAWQRIEESIEESPTQPVRYLFAKGVMQLESGQVERVAATAQEILRHSLAEDEGDLLAEKAADYLNGLAALALGDAEQAIELLRRAVEAPGFSYAVYELGLAQAYRQAGLIEEALDTLESASVLRFEGNRIRSELELGRRLAARLRIDILVAEGVSTEADNLRNEYVAAWGEAGPAVSRTGLPVFIDSN
ncbi:MAG: tetratricopeptide repeat protein [Woeseiaceae bacterium]|nr:tetratricopeptide repeat protein [Woeseiaceae bacterium]